MRTWPADRLSRRTASAVGTLLMAVAGCAGTTVTEVVMDEFGYAPDLVEVPASAQGHVLTLVNDGELPHDFSVEGLPADTPVHLAVLPGGQAPYPLPALPAGEYVIYCGIEGHREAGMEARLVVG